MASKYINKNTTTNTKSTYRMSVTVSPDMWDLENTWETLCCLEWFKYIVIYFSLYAGNFGIVSLMLICWLNYDFKEPCFSFFFCILSFLSYKWSQDGGSSFSHFVAPDRMPNRKGYYSHICQSKGFATYPLADKRFTWPLLRPRKLTA